MVNGNIGYALILKFTVRLKYKITLLLFKVAEIYFL